MKDKTAKSISPDMMMLLMFFVTYCSMLLFLEPVYSQNKFLNMLPLLVFVSIITVLVFLMVGFWKNSRNKEKKTFFVANPKSKINFYAISSFFIGLNSFSLFLNSIVNHNRIPYIGYLSGTIVLIIWIILFVNSQYRKEDQEVVI
jgi:Na+(H+)/acetate symporter ActP